ncbi:hypothetical protein C4573_00925 [Candidatus Woesearchaeota archaeon]|nr:MAG: hypothetical protein C4573_00925 [Candidatus Woesearchaeota archaeon]
MRDFVYFSENAEQMLERAVSLGFSELVLVFAEKNMVEKDNILKNSKIVLKTAIMLPEKSFAKLQKYKKIFDYIIAEGTRKAFETKQIDFVIPDFTAFKDHTHYRQSGMDQIYAKLAKKNNLTVLFDFSLLLESKNKQSMVGRMMQDVALCKKYKAAYGIASFAKTPSAMRSSGDFSAFLRTLQ